MPKYCPYTDADTVYLNCQECDRKICGDEWFFCIVAGSWSFEDYALFETKLSSILRNHPDTVIVSGGADGAEALAGRYAAEHGLPYIGFPANWEKYGKRAGYLRNRQMHGFVSKQKRKGVVAFWDGEPGGTMQNFELAKEFGNELRIVRVGWKKV